MFVNQLGASIQTHPFFSVIDFNGLKDNRVQPPWCPKADAGISPDKAGDQTPGSLTKPISDYHQSLFAGF